MFSWLGKWKRVDLLLSSQFSLLGSWVARSPGIFILVPLLLTLLMGSGVQQFRYTSDIFTLFVPVDAKSIEDAKKIQFAFPENLTRHVRGSELRLQQLVDLILVPRSGHTALDRGVWEEAERLDRAVAEIRVESGGRGWAWHDLCTRLSPLANCTDNQFLSLLHTTDLAGLRYPVMEDPALPGRIFPLLAHLGGVTTQAGLVTHASAIKLSFMLDDSNKWKAAAAKIWVKALQTFMSNVRLQTCEVSVHNPADVERELINNIQTAFENNFPVIVSVISGFTIYNCMSTDWVRSKPLAGILGLLNVLLATLAGFGLSLYLGFPWQAINVVVIFLMIGIGMDGVFLLLSAWSRSEQTSRDLVTRMSLTYADAAVSLTITSLTNVLSFIVGAVVPGFPAVQIFCVYAAIGLSFSYLWNLSLFGAFLAISGHREHSNRHCLLLTKVKSKSEADGESWLYRLLLAGGVSQENPTNSRDNKDDKTMAFFKDTVSPILNFRITKILIIVAFAAYLVVSLLGVYNMKEGLQLQNLAMEDSHVIPHFNLEHKYFRNYTYRIQVVIPEKLNYSDPTVQRQVNDLLVTLEQSKFMSNNSELRQSWLTEYLKVAKENFLLFDISSESKFMENLHIFMEEAEDFPISADVKFSENGSEIVASRFFLQTERIEDAQAELAMLLDMRRVLASTSFSFEVLLFNPFFFIFDQFAEVFTNTVVCVLLCCVIMALVIFIFIPSKVCVIWVILTVLSVEVGVMGMMCHWNINLDMISMIVLIMGIGFSVDFSAHVSYHFLAYEDATDPESRLAHCLHALGPPILQAAATTILSVLPLFRHPSYVIHTFSKMVFLVILFGLLHSLLLLPVLLTMFSPESCCTKSRELRRMKSLNVLSPSNAEASETFIYKNGSDNCLRKQALTGDAKRRKFISPEELVKTNFRKKLSESSEGSILSPPVNNLHLSFFKPTESDDSTELDDSVNPANNCEKTKDIGLKVRSYSDSSYYSYQKRHLRRNQMNVASRLGKPSTAIEDSAAKYSEKFEVLRQDLKRNFRNSPLKFSNNNYKTMTSEVGELNQGFEDGGEVFENSLTRNTKTMSSFKPKSKNDEPNNEILSSTDQSLKFKLIMVEHEQELPACPVVDISTDSFDEVDF